MLLVRYEGGGQKRRRIEEEGAESRNGEKDPEDARPPFPSYALRRVRSLTFLLHCHGVLFRWRLALSTPQVPS